ncbi:hypothetical protein [Acidithiobacillus marinus]|uniref:hypothetical protein n=1 Tax=Acidithiobacillus marinus TaxID=187490 RepID=UPI001557294C|nr:hypothetical protein [Acidithiobacillus marinus]
MLSHGAKDMRGIPGKAKKKPGRSSATRIKDLASTARDTVQGQEKMHYTNQGEPYVEKSE